MYYNVDTALLWLRLIAKYLIKKWNMKRIKAYSCMSIDVDNVFMAGSIETLEKIK